MGGGLGKSGGDAISPFAARECARSVRVESRRSRRWLRAGAKVGAWHLKAGCLLALTVLFSGGEVSAAPPLSEQRCMICHGKHGFKKVDESGAVRMLWVDLAVLKGSVHRAKACTDCHHDVVEIPHKERPARVYCRRCHYKDNPAGAPSSDAYLEYERSVHGRALAGGNPRAPVCQSCHGNHDILHTRNPNSRVAHGRVAATCGRCHLEEYSQYKSSVHGRAVYERGVKDAPDCTGCHGEHSIMAVSDPASLVGALNVARTCAGCHGDQAIMARYGIEAEQVETFEESFHGIAVRFGLKRAANCASCHGTHDIRPPDDPASSVNPANIPRTCGKCHPGANPNYARGKIHVNPKAREAGIVYWVASFFKYLTLVTIAALILHILLDLWRRFKDRGAPA